MRRIFLILIVGVSAAMAGQAPSGAPPAGTTPNPQYRVLHPWAEVDPIPVRGISPRLSTLAGKKIGLFANFKRASRPVLASVEKRLKTMYPDSETFLFDSRGANVVETETGNREKFADWAKRIDAAILAVGD